MTRLARYTAILTLASSGRMKRLSVEDIEALSELADEDGLVLSELILKRRNGR